MKKQSDTKLFDDCMPYTKTEIRKRVGISQPTLWRHIQDGLKVIRIGSGERILGKHANEFYLQDTN